MEYLKTSSECLHTPVLGVVNVQVQASVQLRHTSANVTYFISNVQRTVSLLVNIINIQNIHDS